MKSKGLKRRAIRRRPGSKPPDYFSPKRKAKGSTYSRTKDYEYFEGHIVLEIAKQLSPKNVICWYNDHMLSLPQCAAKKFWQQQKHCKRCPLFQGDAPAQELRLLIEEWEKDDLEENISDGT